MNVHCPRCQLELSSGTRCPHDGAELSPGPPPRDPLLGRTIGARFSIERRLGQGAMAVVYLAREASSGREIALKVLTGRDDERLARFRREARLLARLSSPNVVEVIAFGEDGELPYIAMERLVGLTLEDELKRGPLEPRRARRLLGELARALEDAHALGLVHRDLKPANVFLDRRAGRETVKLLDLGLAKASAAEPAGALFDRPLTRVGALMGTPIYMAPEQAGGDGPVDARADLYSFGVVAYHCLAGRPPFEGAPAEVLQAHRARPPPPLPPELDPALSRLVMELLAKRASERPASAAAVRTRLEAAPGSRGARRRAPLAIGLLVLLGLALGAAFALRAPRSPAPPRGFYAIPIDD